MFGRFVSTGSQAFLLNMCTNCAALLAMLSLYLREADKQEFSRKQKKLVWFFNFTYHYIGVLSRNNSKFAEYVDLSHLPKKNLKNRISLIHYLYFITLPTSKINSEGQFRTNFMTKDIILIFQLWTFHFNVAPSQHVEYILHLWLFTRF